MATENPFSSMVQKVSDQNETALEIGILRKNVKNYLMSSKKHDTIFLCRNIVGLNGLPTYLCI